MEIFITDLNWLNQVIPGWVTKHNSEKNKWYKFLYTRGDVLIIARVYVHVHAYGSYVLRDKDGLAARELMDQMNMRTEEDRWNIAGAGTISNEGLVTEWKSGGYRIETPESLREPIQQEIFRLIKEGKL